MHKTILYDIITNYEREAAFIGSNSYILWIFLDDWKKECIYISYEILERY